MSFGNLCGARTEVRESLLAFDRPSYILFELRYYGSKFRTNPPIIRTPPFREKSLIIVFHRIRTPELQLFNYVRIIRVITVNYFLPGGFFFGRGSKT